jgi:hypothetical protein
MRLFKKPLLAIFIITAFMINGYGQMVTTEEILKADNTKSDALITKFLAGKGFEYNQSAGAAEAKERDASWVFRPFTDKRELVSCFVIKVTDTSGHSKIIVLLYNLQHYKDFVNNILESNFRFNGIISRGRRNPSKGDRMEYKSYLHFRKKGMSFFARESIGFDNSTFYEIIFEQDRDTRQQGGQVRL